MPVTYYLVSAGSPSATHAIAESVGANPLDTAYANFKDLGRRHSGDSVVIVYDTDYVGKMIHRLMAEGAIEKGVGNPDIAYLTPTEALERFRTKPPRVVVTNLRMKRQYGIDGNELIRQLQKLEAQLDPR